MFHYVFKAEFVTLASLEVPSGSSTVDLLFDHVKGICDSQVRRRSDPKRVKEKREKLSSSGDLSGWKSGKKHLCGAFHSRINRMVVA